MNVKQAAEAWRLDIPGAELEAITPILEDVVAKTAKALDHDLSTTDPIHSFHPAGR